MGEGSGRDRAYYRSPEWMAHMRQRGAETGRLGGRPKKPTVAEARKAALKELEPKAIRVLRAQLDSDDERVAQSAAIKILEWTRGKPSVTHKVQANTMTAIRYESAAWRPGPVFQDAEPSPAPTERTPELER